MEKHSHPIPPFLPRLDLVVPFHPPFPIISHLSLKVNKKIEVGKVELKIRLFAKIKGMQNDVSEIKKELRAKSFGYISGALGLVAGLAWNDAIKALLDKIFPAAGDAVIMKFVYAGLVTVAVVILIMNLEKMINKPEQK